ncbi:MAG: tetratricopeptide repeat protein [Pseudomonadota bacterium]
MRHSLAALLLCLVFSVPTPFAIAGDAEDPDKIYIASQLDWVLGDVDEQRLDMLREKSESLRLDEANRLAYLDALVEEGGAALLLDQPRYGLDRLETAERIANRFLERDDLKRLRLQLLLSMAYERNRKLKLAAESLSRAQQVVALREGAGSASQLKLIYRRARLLTANGSLWLAGKQYRSALRLTRKTFGDASPETVEATIALGTFLRTTGEYKKSLTAFRRAIKRMRNADKQYHPLAVPLLMERAETALTGPLAEHALDQMALAIQIMDENPASFSAEERIVTAYRYGEVLMLRHLEGRAMDQFKKAWALAEAENHAEWLARLAKPELISNPLFRAGNPGEAGFSLSYNLSADGRPKQVEVTAAANDHIAVTEFAKDLLRSARVRPPVIAGEGHAIEDQQLNMVFQPYDGRNHHQPLFHLQRNRPRVTLRDNFRNRPAYRPDYRPPAPRPDGRKVRV